MKLPPEGSEREATISDPPPFKRQGSAPIRRGGPEVAGRRPAAPRSSRGSKLARAQRVKGESRSRNIPRGRPGEDSVPGRGRHPVAGALQSSVDGRGDGARGDRGVAGLGFGKVELAGP